MFPHLRQLTMQQHAASDTDPSALPWPASSHHRLCCIAVSHVAVAPSGTRAAPTLLPTAPLQPLPTSSAGDTRHRAVRRLHRPRCIRLQVAVSVQPCPRSAVSCSRSHCWSCCCGKRADSVSNMPVRAREQWRFVDAHEELRRTAICDT